MGDLSRDDRRNHRKQVLQALHDETGSFGGSAAEARVKAYIADPTGASTVEFGFVGGLTLHRFYIDPDKPNQSERRSLWMNVTERLSKPGTKDPGGWSGASDVKMLQAIAEEA